MLLNRGPEAALATCSWVEIGLSHPDEPAAVRDLWERKDLGNFTGGYSATVPSHGAIVIKVSQQ
jgi:alpha-galactosidase